MEQISIPHSLGDHGDHVNAYALFIRFWGWSLPSILQFIDLFTGFISHYIALDRSSWPWDHRWSYLEPRFFPQAWFSNHYCTNRCSRSHNLTGWAANQSSWWYLVFFCHDHWVRCWSCWDVYAWLWQFPNFINFFLSFYLTFSFLPFVLLICFSLESADEYFV